MTRRRRWLSFFGAIFTIAAGILFYGLLIEPDRLVLREETITLPHWPESLDGLRVAIVADLHAGAPHIDEEKISEVVKRTNATNPDIILLPGDFVIQGVLGGKFIAPETSAAILAGLKAPLGVWAVIGNHDWWFSFQQTRDALESRGIRVLEDEAVRITSGQGAFWLVGVGDIFVGEDNMDAALDGVPPNAPILMMTHSPDLFPHIPVSVDLTISGHTHGGQVYIPGLGRPMVPSRFGDRYAVGHIIEGGRHLFVSAGIGTNIIPMRFLVPPEINLLTLKAQSGDKTP